MFIYNQQSEYLLIEINQTYHILKEKKVWSIKMRVVNFAFKNN